MSLRAVLSLRPGDPSDASRIAALSAQVFLDTYAADGVRDDLAREVLREFSEEEVIGRVNDPARRIIVAEAAAALIGYAELDGRRSPPVRDAQGWELARLYVQPQAQRCGAGRSLLHSAEAMARAGGAAGLWLTVWEHNARALAFYAAQGYLHVGDTTFVLEGRAYPNKVLAKAFGTI